MDRTAFELGRAQAQGEVIEVPAGDSLASVDPVARPVVVPSSEGPPPCLSIPESVAASPSDVAESSSYRAP